MSVEIVKRLEIIKSAVAIEEDELIAMQLLKLKMFELDKPVQDIIHLIEAKRFETIAQLIEQYKQDRNGIVIYEDTAIQGLKYELKLLENNLNRLTHEKTEYERQLHEFNAEYVLRLGDLIEQILCLRFRYYADVIDDYPEFKPEADAAKKAYESFKEESAQQLQDLPTHLSDDEKKQLKKLYRKASRLSHPDVVSDEFKHEGEKIFKVLNEAYRQQNLTQIKEILLSLEMGQSFGIASDSVNDKALLRTKIDLLRQHLQGIEKEIKGLKEDETFKSLQRISDWDSYFHDLEIKLKQELTQLQET